MPDSKLIDPDISEVTEMEADDFLYLVRTEFPESYIDARIKYSDLARNVKSNLTQVVEEPVGDIDGENLVFTLSQTPILSGLQVFKNGLLQKISVSGDLTVSGITLTFNAEAVPLEGDTVTVAYFV